MVTENNNTEKKEESKERFKRAPSKLVTIKDLNSDLNRVSLIGTIVSRNSELYSFMIDDGTGTVLVLVNDTEKFKEIEDGQILRVLGRVWGETNEIEIQADIIQDFSKIDIELFRKVYK